VDIPKLMDSLPNENDSADVLANKFASMGIDSEEVPIHAGHRHDPNQSAAMKLNPFGLASTDEGYWSLQDEADFYKNKFDSLSPASGFLSGQAAAAALTDTGLTKPQLRQIWNLSDLDGDGQPELISGWSNGKFEVRSDVTGEVIFKDYMRDGTSVSSILRADYRGDGRTEVIVCSAEGEVRAYLPAGEELDAMGATAIADKLEDETLGELHQRKQELLFELRQCAP